MITPHRIRIILTAILCSQQCLLAEQDSGLLPPLTLEAKDATLKGPALHFNPVVRRLVDWQNRSDIATFTLTELPAGDYALSLSYTAGPDSGGRLRASWNDENLTKPIRQTGGWAKAEDLSLGTVKHAGGPVSISLQAENINKVALMELVSLTIRQTSGPQTRLLGVAGTPKPAASKPATNSQKPPAKDPEETQGRLKTSVPLAVMVDGKSSGKMTLPAGTTVAVVERKESKLRIRWNNLEDWVEVTAVDLPESVENQQESSPGAVPAATPTQPLQANPEPAAEETGILADWDFSKAKKTGASISIPNGPELFGGPLVGENAIWAEIVTDNTAPQGRAVRFEGSSGQRLSSQSAIDIEEDAELQIEIDVNPSESNDSPRRILRVAQSFELRLVPESKVLQMLVWKGVNDYSKVEGKLNFGAWNHVVASYKKGLLEIIVNGEAARRTLPADTFMQGGSAKAMVAHSFENEAFSGMIGRLRLTTRPAEKSANPDPDPGASASPVPAPESEAQAIPDPSPEPPATGEVPVKRVAPLSVNGLDKEVITWDFSKARMSGARITVPGTSGIRADGKGRPLEDWASVEEDASAPGGRTLRLAGGPDQALNSENESNWAEGQPIRIEVEVKPSSTMDSPVPILRSSVFDVGYVPDRQLLNFVVYHKEGYTVATIPAAPDQWHTLVAECYAGVLEVTVNGQTSRTELPQGVVMKAGKGQSNFVFPRNSKSFQGSIGRIAFFTKGGGSTPPEPRPGL